MVLNPEGARCDDAQLPGRDAMKQGPHTLSSFLLSLREALLKQGLSIEAAEFICETAKCGSTPPKIRTVAQYQDAWVVCHVAEDILPALDDGSEVALWCSALAYSCFQFEDTYLAQHGHMPLSPATRDMEGPSGSA